MPALGFTNSCPSGYLYYTCAASNFEGCCNTNACNYPAGCLLNNSPPATGKTTVRELEVAELMAPSDTLSPTSNSIPVVTVTQTSTITSETANPVVTVFTTSTITSGIATETSSASESTATSAFSASLTTFEPTSSSGATTATTVFSVTSSLGVTSTISVASSTTISTTSSTMTAPPSATSTLALVPPGNSHFPARLIGGIVAGGAVAIILVALLIHWLRLWIRRGCHKKLRRQRPATATTPAQLRRADPAGGGRFRLHNLRRSTRTGDSPRPDTIYSFLRALHGPPHDPNNPYNPESFVHSPLNLGLDAGPNSGAKLGNITIGAELEGSPAGAELEGSPVSPVVSSPVLLADSVVPGTIELPADNVARPSRVDSSEPTRVLRSDPTRPNAASWQYYQDLAQEQRYSDIGSWHERSRSPSRNSPYMGANLADMLWRTPTDEVSSPPMNDSRPDPSSNDSAGYDSGSIKKVEEDRDTKNEIDDDVSPGTHRPHTMLSRLIHRRG